jgi:hypothetical protein
MATWWKHSTNGLFHGSRGDNNGANTTNQRLRGT